MNQSIIKGIEHITPLIKRQKFLLVKGHAYDYLEIKTLLNSIPHVEFSGFTSNPLYDQVCKGIDLYNTEKCELIIAIGGGSAIDVAKCIKLFCNMDSNINYLKQEKFDSGIPLIAVPTTAGTGSESTQHAVIYYQGDKQSITHESILPNYAILEPTILKRLPLYQKKCTMMDALCQAIESWWSINSTSESKQYSRKAIAAIKENWYNYIFENTEKSAEKIMEAANYSGRAINITATTAAHAMSYKITSLYKLPHGHAVAICLPEVWEYMLKHMHEGIDIRGREYLEGALSEIASLIDLNYYKYMLGMLELNYPIANQKESDVQSLVDSVNSVRLKNSPVKLNARTLQNMYRRIVR